MGVLPIAHPLRAFGVVAFGDLANPVARIARTLRDVLGQLAARQQPEDLPPRPFVRLFGRTVASLQLVDTQVGPEMNASCHALILLEPSKSWYDIGTRWIRRAYRCSDQTPSLHVPRALHTPPFVRGIGLLSRYASSR